MLDMDPRLRMNHAIVFRFSAMFIAGPLDGRLLSEVGVGVEVGASLAGAFVVFSTGTHARAQMEVVDAESDCSEEKTEHRWDGPINGVVVQGGLNHLFHGGK